MLHMPQKHKATVPDSTHRMEMNALEQADNAKARELHWKPLSWLGTLRPTTAMMLGISRYGRRLSARHWVWRCRYSPPSPAATNARPPCAAARSKAWTFTATTTWNCTPHSGATKAHDGPSEFYALSSAPLGMSSALSTR